MLNVSVYVMVCVYAVIGLSYWLEKTGRCPIAVILNLRIWLYLVLAALAMFRKKH
jgi:hypothetical protein